VHAQSHESLTLSAPREPTGPLAGIRVIETGTMFAGPLVGTLLADYGADVIKVERPTIGDPVRQLEPIKDGKSLWWKVQARNKRLVTLELQAEVGRRLFLDLIQEADVLLENFRPGTLSRWGVGYETLREVNPRLIVLHTSGYGQDGPYSPRPGLGTAAEAMSGVVHFTGFPETPPTLSAFPLADTTAAMFGLSGVLAALHERERSGVGQEIDVALYEPLYRLVETQVIAYDQLGIVKERTGNRLPEAAPRNAYATADDAWLAIVAITDPTFARLAAALDRPDLVEDPRFRDNKARVANATELDAIIGDWTAARSREEALRIFEQHQVVASPIYSIEDIFADPQYEARENIVSVPDPDFGSVKMQGVVPRFSNSRCEVRWVGGEIGAHNDEVLGGLLGLSAEELTELAAQGVV
jgi:succinyl-CoA--D-citramalate CoA-transferase